MAKPSLSSCELSNFTNNEVCQIEEFIATLQTHVNEVNSLANLVTCAPNQNEMVIKRLGQLKETVLSGETYTRELLNSLDKQNQLNEYNQLSLLLSETLRSFERETAFVQGVS